MVKADFIYPDLDILDSPLMSPFTTSLNGVPGSAIAENIFNDPDSWEENDDADDADVDMEPLAWLVEEIEKFKSNSADLYGAFDPAYDSKKNPDLTPLNGDMQLRTGLKGIDRTSKIRPISIPYFFEPASAHDEDIQDRLSKILDASGIPHYVRPLSSDLSPPSTSKSTYFPSKINTSIVTGSNVDGPSPLTVHSSSITMSFLEWYGIYPESDQNLRSLRQQYRKSINSKKMASSLSPPPNYTMPPSPPLSIPPPGLEPPPRSRRPPASTSTQSSPYLHSWSPAGSRPNSNARARSASNSRSQSPTNTQDMSRRDSDAPTRRRRLPSIPLESSLLPPPPASPKFSSTELSSQQPRPASTPRPLPSISSPAGPRTRGSRVSSQESTRGFSMQNRAGPRF